MTAIVLATVFLLGLFLLPWYGFIIFVGLVTLVGAWEWANLAGFTSMIQRFIYSVLTAVVMFLVANYTGLLGGIVYIDETRDLLVVASTWWED